MAKFEDFVEPDILGFTYVSVCVTARNFSMRRRSTPRLSKPINALLSSLTVTSSVRMVLTLVMRKARHLISEQKMFVDWSKFIHLLQFEATQLNKLNFEKPLPSEANNRRRSGELAK